MQVWHVQLFGNLAVSRPGDTVTRFSTRKTGTLLAYLAFYREQGHSREALCDMLWPDDPPEASRARLRVALSSLRRQLEPPGIAPGTVILTDGYEHVRLGTATVTTDVQEVRQALQTLERDASHSEHTAAAHVITTHVNQPLLTDFYEDWVISERHHLTLAAVEHLCTVAKRGPLEAGIRLAEHAARIDPFSETPLLTLLPLLVESGQQSAARRVLRNFERRWEKATGDALSPRVHLLLDTRPQKGGEAALAVMGDASAPASEAPTAQPPISLPLPAAPVPKRLPSYLTRFFGRDEERHVLRDALTHSRLVTLTGPGGIGKTRLAVEVARQWDGSCWFVPLADTSEPERLPAAICDSLGNALKAKPGKDSPEALLTLAADTLSAASAAPLLVLDNLEQLADAAGSTLLSLLERVPHLRLLVTSRLRLHLPGEQEVPLAPLPTPPENLLPDDVDLEGNRLAKAASIPSVALFVDRARAARPDFQITARNQSDVLSVCQTLEGVPLAIELVAARSSALVPAQMRTMLSEHGGLTIIDRRARHGDRHRSLYQAIDWSYRLLPADLRRFFTQLSVFRGGFTVEAAAAVCDAPSAASAPLPALAASEALARLRAHSLVTGIAGNLEMRFTLLESLRTFAAEQLTPEEQADLRRRHCHWFMERAEQSDTAIPGPEQGTWLERLDVDRDNLRAALQYALDNSPAHAIQFSGALWMYWHLRGLPSEGRQWVEGALSRVVESKSALDDAGIFQHARALHGAGTLAWVQGDGTHAEARFNEALRLRREIDDRVGIAGTLNNLGLLHWSRQELDEARRYLGESLGLRREQGATPAALASSLHNLGTINWERGDYVSAHTMAEEALALCRTGGDRVGEGHALNNLGNVALAQGNFADAETCYRQSLALKRTIGYTLGIAATLSNIGITGLYQHNLDDAATALEESLRIYREISHPDGIAIQLRNLGQVVLEQGDVPRATTLMREGLSVRRASDATRDIALHLEGFVLLAAANGQADTAARLWGAAESCRARFSTPLHPSERVALDKVLPALQAALTPEAFAIARQSGTALSVDATVDLVLKSFS